MKLAMRVQASLLTKQDKATDCLRGPRDWLQLLSQSPLPRSRRTFPSPS